LIFSIEVDCNDCIAVLEQPAEKVADSFQPRQVGGFGGLPDPDSGPASGVDAG